MDEAIKTLPDLLDGERFAMLTLASVNGLDARPLTIQRTELHAVWFLVSDRTPWLPEVGGDAGLSIVGDGQWVSLAGACEVIEDQETIAELGDPVTDAWFEDGHDPVALRFDVVRGEWWSAPSFVRTAIEVAIAKITGDVAEVGDHGRVA